MHTVIQPCLTCKQINSYLVNCIQNATFTDCIPSLWEERYDPLKSCQMNIHYQLYSDVTEVHTKVPGSTKEVKSPCRIWRTKNCSSDTCSQQLALLLYRPPAEFNFVAKSNSHTIASYMKCGQCIGFGYCTVRTGVRISIACNTIHVFTCRQKVFAACSAFNIKSCTVM